MTAGSSTQHLAQTQGMPPLRYSRARRATFFSFVGLGTILGTWLLFVYLGQGGLRKSEIALLLVFLPLYYQLNTGFWTALVGVWLMNRPKSDPLELWRTLAQEDYEKPLEASTAVIMPIYNEDVPCV